TFTDVDTIDAHSASYTPQGTGYLGTFKLDSSQIDTGNGGTVGWSFSVADDATDYLAAGQTLTQRYDVKVDDGHGGTKTQTVTVTITRTNEAPVISGAGNTVGYTEQASPVVVDSSIAVSDVDTPTLSEATATISAGYQSGDVLTINGATDGTIVNGANTI